MSKSDKFDIDSELSEEVMGEVKQCAAAEVAEQNTPEIVVRNKCAGQEYCVICVLGNNCRQKCTEACIQVLGAFPTIESAKKFAKEVSEASPQFDLYCASMYKWLPLNTRPEDATNTHWRNEKVEELMQDYMQTRALSKEIFEERKHLCADQNKKDNELIEVESKIEEVKIE